MACGADCDKIAEVPIWIVHNTGDDVVSYSYAIEAATFFSDELNMPFLSLPNTKLSNNQIERSHILTAFNRDGHDAWNRAYASPELYKWLLSKTK